MVRVRLCHSCDNSSNTLCLCCHTSSSYLFEISFELRMNPEIVASFGTAVHELFIRWDALKLAVEHMGGRNGQQVRRNEHFKYTFRLPKHTIYRYVYHSDGQRDQRLRFQLLYAK